MTEEPYRWLEAIQNRREYIRDQLKGGTPVFALTRPQGILLLGVGHGHSKVFEVYNRHGLAALGHPVDIEKIRQAAIEAAHLEGFNRSPQDVTLRRLISFALSANLKSSFEQIFSPPLMVECVFAELGPAADQDVLVRVHYDGNHHYATDGTLVAHYDPPREQEALQWLRTQLRPDLSLVRAASLCLTAWHALMENLPFQELAPPTQPVRSVAGKVVEAALLDRQQPDPVRFRPLDLATLDA